MNSHNLWVIVRLATPRSFFGSQTILALVWACEGTSCATDATSEGARAACSAILSHETPMETMNFPWNFHWFPLIIVDSHWFLMISVDFHWFLMIFADYWGRACGPRSLQGPRSRLLMPNDMPPHVPSALWVSQDVRGIVYRPVGHGILRFRWL